LSKPRAVRVDETSPTESPVEESAPAATDARSDTDLQVIPDARQAGSSFSAGLTEFFSSASRPSGTSPPVFHEVAEDRRGQAEVAVVDGKEDTQRHDQRAARPSSGGAHRRVVDREFSTTLDDVLSWGRTRNGKRRGGIGIADRPALVFHYTVEQANSHWTLSARTAAVNPPFEGAVWIDRESRRVLRIEQRSRTIPREFPFSKANAFSSTVS